MAPRAWQTGLLAGTLAILIGTLGVLQYRWLGQVSDAELSRTRAEIKRRADEAARKIDSEIGRAFLTFMISTDEDVTALLQQRWELWRNSAPFPQLIERVYFAPNDNGTVGALQRLDNARLTPVDWPTPLARMRDWLNTTLQQLGPVLRVTDLASGRALAIIVPTFDAAGPAAEPARAPRGFVVLGFNRAALLQKLIPDALASSFSDLAAEYRATVWSPEDRAAGKTAPDAVYVAEIFGVRFDRIEPNLIERIGTRAPPNVLFDPRGVKGRGAGWAVAVHRNGATLETTIGSLRTRNIVMAFAMLSLLGGAALLLTVQVRRARLLADQRRHLMAAVSHELRTPLAVIRSAAENLADGVVSDATRVQEYGRRLSVQARRLTDLVDRVLQTASPDPLILAASQVVDPIDLVENALATHAEQLASHRFEIVRQLDQETPAVQGDPEALRRAVENLIENVLKHAKDGRYLHVRAHRLSSDPSRIEIAIADRGPGIERNDREGIFVPFSRGQATRTQKIPGVGLGLSLVRQIARAHGGEVETENLPTGGAEFRLLLPLKGLS